MPEISVVPFKFKHYSLLEELFKSQNTILSETMKTLPKIGYIALMGDQPIAVGFLRKVEPCFAQIDTLASNAHFGSQIRHQGLTLVVDSLLVEAKTMKLQGIIATTKDPGVLKRAETYGFHVTGDYVIGRKL